MTMRAMDDVKESCRAAAATTMHTLQSVTLRLADPAATAADDAARAMNMMLPFLLTKCKSPSHGAHSHVFTSTCALVLCSPFM